jgi:type IV secretory pathway VirB10-like protein
MTLHALAWPALFPLLPLADGWTDLIVPAVFAIVIILANLASWLGKKAKQPGDIERMREVREKIQRARQQKQQPGRPNPPVARQAQPAAMAPPPLPTQRRGPSPRQVQHNDDRHAALREQARRERARREQAQREQLQRQRAQQEQARLEKQRRQQLAREQLRRRQEAATQRQPTQASTNDRTSSHPLRGLLTSNLRQAVIVREVLDKPLALRD